MQNESPVGFDAVRERLRVKEYRLTPQREAILKVLSANTDQHLSAEELYKLVKAGSPDVGLATVYRMLDILEDVGVVSRFDSGEGRGRYEMRPPEQKHYHHHLICLECSKITEFAYDGLETIEQSVAGEHDFEVTDHCLRLYGYCRECRASRRNQEMPGPGSPGK